MVRYFIPGRIGDEDYYAVIEGDDVRFVSAKWVEVDPFSRVANPGLRPGWADEFRLSDKERRSFENARYAYTNAYLPVAKWSIP